MDYYTSVMPGTVPVPYQYKNVYNASFDPSTMHVEETGLNRFFERYLLQECFSIYDFTLPEHWSREYFLYCLFYWGYVAVFNTDKFGVIPQACGLEGFDVFYRPKRAIVSNPLIKNTLQLTIGVNCELVKLMPDWGGVWDIVQYYANLLALCSQGSSVNILNSKLAYVLYASNKAESDTYKKLLDQILSGEPAVVMRKQNDLQNNMQPFTQNLSANYIAGDIMSDARKILDEFHTRIGIPNANTDKKERLITGEVNSNNVATGANVYTWYNTLQDCARKVRDMFGIDFQVEWSELLRGDTIYGGSNDTPTGLSGAEFQTTGTAVNGNSKATAAKRVKQPLH